MRGLVLNLVRVEMDMREMIYVCISLGLCSFDCLFDVRLNSSCIGSHYATLTFLVAYAAVYFFSSLFTAY